MIRCFNAEKRLAVVNETRKSRPLRLVVSILFTSQLRVLFVLFLRCFGRLLFCTTPFRRHVVFKLRYFVTCNFLACCFDVVLFCGVLLIPLMKKGNLDLFDLVNQV